AYRPRVQVLGRESGDDRPLVRTRKARLYCCSLRDLHRKGDDPPGRRQKGIERSIHGELLGADEYELHPVQATRDLAAARGPAGGPDESHVNQSLSAGALRCDGNRMAAVARSRGQGWYASRKRRPSDLRAGGAFGRPISIGPLHVARQNAEYLPACEPFGQPSGGGLRVAAFRVPRAWDAQSVR